MRELNSSKFNRSAIVTGTASAMLAVMLGGIAFIFGWLSLMVAEFKPQAEFD